jgi:CBS domain-containing protein
VVDAAGGARGWLPAARAAGEGTAGSAMQRLEEPVPVAASLKDAMSVLLRSDAEVVPVVDGGRLAGVLTAGTVHTTLRRSIQGG